MYPTNAIQPAVDDIFSECLILSDANEEATTNQALGYSHKGFCSITELFEHKNQVEFTKCTALDLSGNNLHCNQDVVLGLLPFSNLRHLRLDGNKLKSVGQLAFLPAMLETLNLSGNDLTNLTEAMTALSTQNNLRVLDLSNNRITFRQPSETLVPTNLETLYLANNALDDARSALITLAPFQHLKNLDLSGNVFTSFPVLNKGDPWPKKIKYLDMRNNFLPLMPEPNGTKMLDGSISQGYLYSINSDNELEIMLWPQRASPETYVQQLPS